MMMCRLFRLKVLHFGQQLRLRISSHCGVESFPSFCLDLMQIKCCKLENVWRELWSQISHNCCASYSTVRSKRQLEDGIVTETNAAGEAW